MIVDDCRFYRLAKKTGKIVKYYDLKDIRKQAKEVLTKAISKMPYADSLRAVGLDPDTYEYGISADV